MKGGGDMKQRRRRKACLSLLLAALLLSGCGVKPPAPAAAPEESAPTAAPEPTVAPTAAPTAMPAVPAEDAAADAEEDAPAQDAPRADSMTKGSHKTTRVDWNYWIYEPDIPAPEEGLPLVVYMHGDGGKGSNPDRLVLSDSGLGRLLYEGTVRLDALVLVAQSSNAWRSLYDDFAELIDWTAETYHADPDRVSVVGCSAGGVGCFQMILRYPARFCCAAVLGGAVSPKQAADIRIPLRIYHGEKDSFMGFSVVRASEQINANGGQAELIMMKGVRHSEQIALSESEWGLWDWVLAQKRETG